MIRRRVLVTLSLAQLASSIGTGAALGVGSLVAVELGGSDAWAGATTLAISVVATLTALPLTRLALAVGRRRALSLGVGLALVGAVGMVIVPVVASLPLLLVSAALLGFGSAANLQARFAATDLSDEHSRARDLGTVVWAITVGAVAGPNLIGPGATVGASVGLPPMSGPFLFSVAGMVVALVVLNVGLRPDPLSDRARDLAGLGARSSRATRPGLRAGLRLAASEPRTALGVATVAIGHLVMVAIMSLTPVHLTHVHGGHGPDVLMIIGFTISLHIAGMYALSPVVGWAADRFGRLQVMIAAQAVLAASLVVGLAWPDDTLAIQVSLVLLGIGWSMSTIAGSAYVTESVAGEDRLAIQGLTDTSMGLAGALGALVSGVGLALVGFTGSNMVALVLIVALTVWQAGVLSRGTRIPT